MSTTGPTTAAQLSGVRVVDLGIWRPAPYAAQLLAELGAEVIKVEPPGGDPMRAFPSLYAVLNGAKQVVEIDLKSDDGRASLEPLLARADVVLEGFRPGVAARLGVAVEDVRALNRSAVYCSISGFGQDGPLAAASGHDLNYQAWAGMLAPDLGPETPSPQVPVADLAGGTFAAMAICAALARRGIVGPDAYEGERIDVSMADVLASWAGPGTAAAADRTAHRFPGYGVFACADGLVALGVVSEDPFWHALCTELGLEGVADLDAVARATDGPALHALLSSRIAHYGRDDLVSALLEVGVPVAPVLTRTEALRVEHFAARGTVSDGTVGHPVHYG